MALAGSALRRSNGWFDHPHSHSANMATASACSNAELPVRSDRLLCSLGKQEQG